SSQPMFADIPATPLKPSTAAISAITKKVKAQFSMVRSPSLSRSASVGLPEHERATRVPAPIRADRWLEFCTVSPPTAASRGAQRVSPPPEERTAHETLQPGPPRDPRRGDRPRTGRRQRERGDAGRVDHDEGQDGVAGDR